MRDISNKIIVQASQGGIESFETIYRAYSGFVYNVAYRVTNDASDAQEITQDVFLTIYRKLKSFQFKSSFRTWTYRITINLAINHAKKKSKEKDLKVDYDENMELRTFVDPANETIDRDHQKKLVSVMLAALNPDQRVCLVLRDFEGLNYEEIAKTLKIKTNTVRSRLKRARERLLSLSKEVLRNEM